MSDYIADIKAHIHQLVEQVSDRQVLEQIEHLLTGQPETDILDDLSLEQLTELQRAREQARTGNYISLSAHKAHLQQWLQDRR